MPCDPARARALSPGPVLDLRRVVFPRHGDGEPVSVAHMLDLTDTDAFLVLHRGRIVVESYRHGMHEATPHILMSVSKSVTAVVAGQLVGRGLLDPAAQVTDYLPEVSDSAFAGATLRDLLDMRAGVRFDEEYLAAGGPFVEYRIAMGWNPRPVGAEPTDLRAFLAGMRERSGAHGGPMHYVSPVTDLLGWVVERAAGRRFADLLSELLWGPMGAATEACVTVDRLGAPRTAGGLCCTLRDLARLGLLLLEGGRRDGEPVVPVEWLEDVQAGGDRVAWDEGDYAGSMSDRPLSYRSQWYVMREGARSAFFGVGIHGQYLWVEPGAQMVAVKFSSQPAPSDDVMDRLSLDGLWALGGALR